MFAGPVIPLDQGSLRCTEGATGQESIDLVIADAHLPFIGLAVIQPRRRGLFQYASWGVQESQELVDLPHSEISDGVEVAGAIAPLGEIAQINLAAVART